jgi:hypothetical protein
MTKEEILALTDLFLTGLEKLGPRISQLAQKGEISIQQQSDLIARMSEIGSATAFTDPAWQPEAKS